jgi:hypothetical protein
VSLRATLRRSWPVLVSYGIFSMWGVGCLFTSLVLTSGGLGMAAGDVVALAGVLVATVVGHVLGNLLGLAGLRLLPITLLFLGLFIGSALSGVVLGVFAFYLVIATIAAFGGYLGVASRLDVVASWYPLAFSIGGAIHWMNRHGAVATFQSGTKHAVWDPFTIVCLTGTVFLMLTFLATRHSLGLTTWQEVGRMRGARREPTDPVAVARPGRGSFVVLFLFTLAILGVTALLSPYLFRTHSVEGDGPSKEELAGGDEGAAKGQSSGSKGSLGNGASSGGGTSSGQSGSATSSGGGTSSGQSGSATSSGGGTSSGQSGSATSSGGGTSSGQSGSATSSGGGASSGQSGGEASSGDGSNSGGKPGGGGSKGGGKSGGDGSKRRGASGGGDSDSSDDGPIGKPNPEHAGNAAGEALDLGLKIFLWLLVAALALLLFVVVFVPPLRRAMLMRHLERPLWPVAPTARVMNLWRRAIAVLGTIDIEPAAGETRRDFASRVERELASSLGCESPGLKEAAAIVEKIDYAGRGLGAGDEQTMREAIDAFIAVVSPRIPVKRKLAAAWGKTPEVES